MRDRRGMSNVLKVSLQTTIYSLADRGWSQRRIARELGINRETVGRYLRLAEAKPAISTPGSGGDSAPKPAILTLRGEEKQRFKTGHFDRRQKCWTKESMRAFGRLDPGQGGSRFKRPTHLPGS